MLAFDSVYVLERGQRVVWLYALFAFGGVSIAVLPFCFWLLRSTSTCRGACFCIYTPGFPSRYYIGHSPFCRHRFGCRGRRAGGRRRTFEQATATQTLNNRLTAV